MMNKKWLYERVDPREVFKHYLGFFSFRKGFKNPLRVDSNPDCHFFLTNDNDIIFHDFARAKGYDCIKIVQEMYNLSYVSAIAKISEDMNLQSDIQRQFTFDTLKEEVKYDIKFEYELKRWSKKEYQYWLDYGITSKTLKKYRVRSCNWIGVNKKILFSNFENNPIFIYETDVGQKMYRPLSKEKVNKWRQNLPSNYIFGLEHLPEKGKMLIITKSLKDVMVLDQIGYKAISPTSETSFIEKETINELKSRFKRIIVIADNDKTGEKMAEHYFINYEIPYLFLDDCKDCSDYSKKHGISNLKKYLKILLC